MSRPKKPIARNFNSPRQCGTKNCYENRLVAEQVVAEKIITDPGIELKIYRCLTCHQWHLTRVKPV